MKRRSVEEREKRNLHRRRTHRVRRVLIRVLAVLGVTVVCAAVGAYGLCFVVFRGPSEMARDQLVLSMEGSSALKKVPYLFLPKQTVKAILASNNTVAATDVTDPSLIVIPKHDDPAVADEWENCADGIRLTEIGGGSYHGWLVTVRDPSRLFVATSGNFSDPEGYGAKISKIYNRTHAAVIVNGGGFPDAGGVGHGGVPLGLTYAEGKRVYGNETGTYSGFAGFTNDNVLVVGDMSAKKADELGVRDGVCFGPVLVVNGEVQSFTSAQGGLSARTCIGQRADGAVLLLVIDGRQPGSLGASFQDVASVMAKYGAVNAINLDGGSSTLLMMNGELINTCCSLYGPRSLPTYFAVRASEVTP